MAGLVVADDLAGGHRVVQHDTDASVFVTSRVESADPSGFTLVTGEDRVRYETRPDGLFKPKSGYYLLKDPIEAGRRWDMGAETKGHVAIAAVGFEHKLPSGTFRGCLRVIEEVDGRERAEWIYARGVGPVAMKIFDLSGDAPLLILSGTLRGHQIGPADEEAPR